MRGSNRRRSTYIFSSHSSIAVGGNIYKCELYLEVHGESSAYIDVNDVALFKEEFLGEGASGGVFKGMYRGQDVAVKVTNVEEVGTMTGGK